MSVRDFFKINALNMFYFLNAEIFCDPPEPPENGSISELLKSNFTLFPYNFQITYECIQGYQIFGGDSWRFCGKNGWSGKTPHCKGKTFLKLLIDIT